MGFGEPTMPKFEVVPSNLPEKGKEMEGRIKDIDAQMRNFMIDSLVKEFPNLEREKVMDYIYGYSEEVFEAMKKEHSAGKPIFPLSFGFNSLVGREYMNTDSKDEKDEARQLLDVGSQSEIFFGHFSHEDLLVKEDIAAIRFDLISESLRHSFNLALSEKRQAAAEGLLNYYVVHKKDIPSKLKALWNASEYSKLMVRFKEWAKLSSIGTVVMDIREEHAEGQQFENEELVEEGVHPSIVRKRGKVLERNASADREAFTAGVRETKQREKTLVEEIVEKNADPRTFYDWIIDADKARLLVEGINRKG